MTNFFRLQEKNISLEQMKQYRSTDPDGTQYNGVCATMGPDDNFGGLWPVPGSLKDDYEIVIFTGHITEEIYDGYVVDPQAEVARFSIRDWERMIADESAWDYEDW